MISRRGFLGSILAAAAAPAIVRASSLMKIASPVLLPTFEETLAITGAVSGGGNTLLTIDMITKEALRILHKNIAFVSMMNNQYAREIRDRKAGDRLIIRTPMPFKVRP